MKYIEINFQTRVFLPVRVKPFLPVWTIYIDIFFLQERLVSFNVCKYRVLVEQKS